MAFPDIASEELAGKYYSGLLGLTGRLLVEGLEIDRERLARWVSPPNGLIHLLNTAGDPATEKICIIENLEGRWLLWLEWETLGYGHSLIKALEKYPTIEYHEKQWIITHLRTINQAIDRSLKTYRHPIPFRPSPLLLL